MLNFIKIIRFKGCNHIKWTRLYAHVFISNIPTSFLGFIFHMYSISILDLDYHTSHNISFDPKGEVNSNY